jgi:hypothetical protein
MKSRLNEVKIEEIDELLTQLAKEFNVSKPNYCVYKINCIKKLKPWESLGKLKATLKTPGSDPISTALNAAFVSPFGKGEICYITLFLRSRGISRKSLVHEFFHYLHYVKNGYKFKSGEEEEKQTIRKTQQYLRKLKEGR